ncbi:MAG: glycosyltransferase family A protein [Holophaga sp.]|nr:glycosyltransferase family A protein [Holophaga sp.]
MTPKHDRLETEREEWVSDLEEPLAGLLALGLRLPLVSVVVTAFNGEQFIRETLESVLAQTYRHFECFIVEDCSTDRTLAVVERFLEERPDPRFRLVRHEANGGQLAGQITGFQESNGEFIVYLDADDLLFPDALKDHLFFHLTCAPIVAMTCLDSAMIDQDDVLLAGHHREIKPLLWPWLHPRPERKQAWIRNGILDYDLVPSAACNAILLTDEYYWTTQSFMMFRRDALELILPAEKDMFRICADFYLVRMTHAFNATIMIHKTGGAYRLHASNHYSFRGLISAEQQSGDQTKSAWQCAELGVLAARVIRERYDQFAAFYGTFHVSRALLSLPRKAHTQIFRPALKRCGWLAGIRFLGLAYLNHWLTGTRLRCGRAKRILWAGH